MAVVLLHFCPHFDPLLSLIPGHPGERVRPEGPAAAAPEAHDPPSGARGHAHPVPVALLRGGRTLNLDGHVEDTPDTAEVAATVRIIFL